MTLHVRIACLCVFPLLLLPTFGARSAMADGGNPLQDLFEREWEQRLANDPLLATAVGRNEYDHLLPSVRPEDLARQAEADRAFLAELAEIEKGELSDEERINAQIFRRQLRDRVADFELGAHEIPINSDSGFHIHFARLPTEMPMATVEHYERYLTRLEALPAYMAQQITNMRAGVRRGMSLPGVVLQGYGVTIASHMVETPAESLFFRPFESFPASVPVAAREGLRQRGEKVVMQSVVPAYSSFFRFMQEEYIPRARTTIGASELPNGEAFYAHKIRHFTTLDLSAAEIHKIGLAEVKRIRGEMQEVIDGVGFEGSFADFLQFLRTDPRFYAETPEELLKEASYIAKRMDAQLPALFGTLPRLPYGVAPVPDHLAPKYTGGRYVASPEGSTQPGYYWVNTYNLKSRPLYILEALSLHEAVPGHHLQISLNNEREGLPEFRRFSYLSAFGEGWGLYSEWLGLEAGFYTDPYSNFGRLTYEMWRACRLVVDTGLHAMGWSRQQAMDYLAERTALSLHEVETETDRYIAWPAQALSYKLGELKIKELRSRAEETLGEGFDIREFHDVVLLGGSVPLTVLEGQVDAYLAAKAP